MRLASWLFASRRVRSFWIGVATLCTSLGADGANAAISHVGSQDPSLEGWLPSTASVDVLSAPIVADPEYPGVSAWSVDDPTSNAGSASFYAAPPTEIPLDGQSWRFSARLRVVDLADAVDMGVFLEVTNEAHRRFLLTFGSDAAGNTRLHLSSDGNVSTGGTTWVIPKIVALMARTEYLKVDLVSDGSAADLLVNGQRVGSGLTGYVAAPVPPRVIWGAGSSVQMGHGHYAELRFERAPSLECANGIDDDGDGAVDYAGGDPDCASALDPLERAPVVPCDDGVDTDADDVCDVDEDRIGTDSNGTDSDGDGLLDGDELALYGTNPAAADSDGDGFSDSAELLAGRDPTDPTSGPPPQPAWDFVMPSRFIERDPSSAPSGWQGDHYFVGDVHPESWRVDFDACATDGLVFEYRWYVDDALVENRPICSGFQHDFPDEGAYDIRLVVVGTGGEQAVAERTIQVQDLLIFGLGDSYASGEGDPDRPVTLEMVADYEDTLVALDQAAEDAATAYAAWQSQLALFDDLVGRVDLAYARLGIWQARVDERNAACLSFPFTGCAEAQIAASTAAADLVWALANIGIPEPSNFTYAAIYAAITDVYNAGLTTYTAVESAWQVAQAAVDDSQQIVDVTKAGLVADWQDENCHRSAYSGQVQAAKRIEESDPHTSVTFIHLACSGAKIVSGKRALIGDDDTPAAASNNEHQVVAMRTLAEGHAIDAVFLSIGGNDAQFANIILACIETEPCFQPDWIVDTAAGLALDALCATTGWFLDTCALDFDPPPLGESAQTMFDDAKAELSTRYASLHHWLEGEYPRTASGELNTLGRLVKPGRVYLTEYPDFTRDEQGEPCGWSPLDPTEVSLKNLPGVSEVEHRWASDIVAADLRAEMAAASGPDGHGWNFVTGISAPFTTHGYCASDPWIVRIEESLRSQGDHNGVVHPDHQGHLAYADALETRFLPEPGLATGLCAGLVGLALGQCRRRSRALAASSQP